MDLARFKNPEYTGENRCPPCTAANVFVLGVVALVAALVWLPLAAGVLVGGLAAIYVRGYLVPGTPTLTKRYVPDPVLAAFDKADGGPPTASGGTAAGTADDTVAVNDPAAADGPDIDPERLLVGAGVVEECATEDDLCLTPSFETAWREYVERLRADERARERAASDVYDREVTLTERNGTHVALADGTRLNGWVSEGAMLADLAAASAVADAADDPTSAETWEAVPPAQREGILRALRSFLPDCPLCGGTVRMTEETVGSCCRSWEVLAVRCGNCDAHYLELDPDSMDAVDPDGGSEAATSSA